MSKLYRGGRDQALQIACSTVQSSREANLCLRAFSKEAQGEGFVHGFCLPWPDIIYSAIMSPPVIPAGAHACTGAVAVSRRPQVKRGEGEKVLPSCAHMKLA